jgi:hypothetical protein
MSSRPRKSEEEAGRPHRLDRPHRRVDQREPAGQPRRQEAEEGDGGQPRRPVEEHEPPTVQTDLSPQRGMPRLPTPVPTVLAGQVAIPAGQLRVLGAEKLEKNGPGDDDPDGGPGRAEQVGELVVRDGDQDLRHLELPAGKTAS